MSEAEQELPLHKKLNIIRDLIKAIHFDLYNDISTIDPIHKQVSTNVRNASMFEKMLRENNQEESTI